MTSKTTVRPVKAMEKHRIGKIVVGVVGNVSPQFGGDVHRSGALVDGGKEPENGNEATGQLSVAKEVPQRQLAEGTCT